MYQCFKRFTQHKDQCLSIEGLLVVAFLTTNQITSPPPPIVYEDKTRDGTELTQNPT